MKFSTFTYSDTNQTAIPNNTIKSPDRTLLIMFGPSHLLDAPAPVQSVLAAYPGAPAIGCSSSGKIFGTHIQDDTLVTEPGQSVKAAQSLARQLMAPGLRGVLVLSDGLGVNGSELIRGLNTVLPVHVVVSGGLAGDGERFKRTWVVKDGLPAGGYVTAVGLYGTAVRLTHGSKGGWDLFGSERLITRSQGNVLYELNHKPALQLYKDYLGELASDFPAQHCIFPHPSDRNRKMPNALFVASSPSTTRLNPSPSLEICRRAPMLNSCGQISIV